MGDVGKRDEVLHSENAAMVVRGLRESFNLGKTRSFQWRKNQLEGILRMIEEREGEIMEALYSDLAKPQMESFLHEISMAKGACMVALKNLKSWMKPEKVGTLLSTYPSTSSIVPEPFGVVLIISAWNYPFLLSIEPVIGAIAAGNAVVLKPSEISPATSSLLARLLPQYTDNLCVKVVEGAVTETTALLEQKWDKIFYTGNGRVGRLVMAAAAKHLTPVVLELGGKSPVVVDSNIDLKVAMKRIAVGKWGCTSGQACIAPDYIITTKSFASKVADEMIATVQKFYGKNPLESTDLARIVNSNHFARLSKLLDDDLVSGKIVYGGQRDEKRLRIAPTLMLDVPEDSLIMRDEIFGPLLPIITVDKIQDSFDFINSRTKPLAAYLFTNDKQLEKMFVENVSAGGMCVNDTVLHMANKNLPFGGVGESGTGAYHGKFSFDAFSHKKSVLSRNFGGEIGARYPPYTPRKQKIVRALLSGDIIGLIMILFFSKSS
ncbi:uncharacterized protein A4U43_C02F6630 [Asparagus officinalis]|uniref:Aldehyde dehydrogenase n=1 Tax=Asparagus officinalis TaxID=4686 RepID=A0A5P1FGH0_ASPOF|nr:aldehyde dehydrogenase family 3 member H1-like [Asparagus officinalis]ONK77448.1 uncharacterized protein A4U43_C02F6630 [Asparagus officinalis]